MISIITPTYNRQDLIQGTIRSILNQTYTDWELIVVDDGSTDNTGEMMKQLFLSDPRIRYIKKKNSGQADSLNEGAKYANGDFITFLDSDDEAYTNWLKEVTDLMKPDTGIVCVAAKRKFLDGTIINEDMNEYFLFGEKMRLKFTCGSCFIRRSLFNQINGYDATMKANIQTDLGYRLLTAIRQTDMKIVTSDAYLVQINIHAGERIRTNWQRRIEGGVQFINKHYDFIRDNDPKEISNIYGSIAYSCFKMRRRMESVKYLFAAIRHNPAKMINYMRIIRYAIG